MKLGHLSVLPQCCPCHQPDFELFPSLSCLSYFSNTLAAQSVFLCSQPKYNVVQLSKN